MRLNSLKKHNSQIGKLAALVLSAAAVFSAKATTVAYWPMSAMAKSGGTYVTNSLSGGYDLQVPGSSEASFEVNDIGWTMPPNPDQSILSGAECTKMLRIGASKNAALSSTSAELANVMQISHSFTLEGWYNPSDLPNEYAREAGFYHPFVFMNRSAPGGWMFSICPTNGTDDLRFDLSYNSGSVKTITITTLNASEFFDPARTDNWHHFAMVCDYNDSSHQGIWKFYLDGRLRGNAILDAFTPSAFGTAAVYVFGVGSSDNRTPVGTYTCWRLSDVALAPEELLCGAAPAVVETIAYWPMNVVSLNRDYVPCSVNPEYCLDVRASAAGGRQSVANDIGWDMPQNPGPEGAAYRPASFMLRGYAGEKIGGVYQPVLESASAALGAELMITRDFTFEGYYRAETLPETRRLSYLVLNTQSQLGGWGLCYDGPNENGEYLFQMKYNVQGGTNPSTANLCTVKPWELLRWCHYAITVDADDGAGKTQVKLYINGRLCASSSFNRLQSETSFNNPRFMMIGASSGNVLHPEGTYCCWRASRKVLTRGEFLCEGSCKIAGSYEWRGGDGTSADWCSSGGGAFWYKDGVGLTTWAERGDAYFGDEGKNCEPIVNGQVNPRTLTICSDKDWVFWFKGTKESCFGKDLESITKVGAGEVTIYKSAQSPMSQSEGEVHVREGVLRIKNPNGVDSLGNTANGFDVYVYEGGKLWLNDRAEIFSSNLDDPNNCRITVYTNGIFSLSESGSINSTFNVIRISELNLMGGVFVTPSQGSPQYGYILVKDRVVFGKKPDKLPYEIPALASGGFWAFGENTEIRVEDITEDESSDVIFNSALVAQPTWQTTDRPFGFRKTGAGALEINNGHSYDRPLGVIAVEEGELRVNNDYSTPSKFTVASGATVSGVGKVSAVELADGAVLKTQTSEDKVLICKSVDVRGGGTAEITNSANLPIEKIRVTMMDVSETIAGETNLASWTVKVNGAVEPDLKVFRSGSRIRCGCKKGLVVVVR